MFLSNLSGGRRLPAGLFGRRRVPGVLSASAFADVFQRECALVYRHTHSFSLVVFDTREPSERKALELARVLLRRVRTGDVVGRLRGHRIVTLLPFTDGHAAWTFVDDLVRRMAEADLKFRCVVYTFPPPGEATPELESGVDEAGRPIADMTELMVVPMPLWKRSLDVVGATIALVLLSPVMFAIALAIKLTSPGPVFFTQMRAGVGGRPFRFYKFRSMYVDAEERRKELIDKNERDGPVFKIKRDPRITPVGRILRRSSLDELPQFWNVLKGDMTLVGPRPATVDEVEKYAVWQRQRLNLKGGITCTWQVSGRCEVSFEESMRMDARYVEQQSLLTDLGLLASTAKAVVTGRGAY